MSDAQLPDEVPEADALEQRQEVGAVGDGMEVPEADAIEQARVVPTDDEPDPEDA
jgi:hypothetical protein